MKKIFLALTILAGISFVSCDPIEDDFDAPKSVKSADDFNVTATTIFMTDENGAEYAVGVIENHSPIPSWIEYNVPDFGDETTISGIKNGCSVVLRAEGPNRFIVHGINPDGSEVSKEVFAECPAGKVKAELPSLESLVWEPLIGEDGEPLLPKINDWNTNPSRFADPAGGEGVMGQWDQQAYDAKMKGKNVFIEFDKPWTGQIMVMTGYWSLQQTYFINGDGVNKTYKFFMDPALIEMCYTQHLAFTGTGGLAEQDVHIVKMYTLLEL